MPPLCLVSFRLCYGFKEKEIKALKFKPQSLNHLSIYTRCRRVDLGRELSRNEEKLHVGAHNYVFFSHARAHNYARGRHFTNPSILARGPNMPQHLPTHIPPLTRLLHLTLLPAYFSCRSHLSRVSVQNYANFLPAESMQACTHLKARVFYSSLIFGL